MQNWPLTIFRAAHFLSAAVYIGCFIFLLVVFERVYRKYQDYQYVDNFRAEVIRLCWQILHVSFLFIVLSGAALAGLKGKSVVHGFYGLTFSTKLALWLLQIYLSQEILRPYPQRADFSEPHDPSRLGPRVRAWLVVSLLLLISLCGFLLTYIPWD